MTSQLVIFRAVYFFVLTTLNLKKKSRKSTNKKNLASFKFLSINGDNKAIPIFRKINKFIHHKHKLQNYQHIHNMKLLKRSFESTYSKTCVKQPL